MRHLPPPFQATLGVLANHVLSKESARGGAGECAARSRQLRQCNARQGCDAGSRQRSVPTIGELPAPTCQPGYRYQHLPQPNPTIPHLSHSSAGSYADLMTQRYGKWGGRGVAVAQVRFVTPQAMGVASKCVLG